MDYGYFIKWSDEEYDINVEPDKRDSGYNVVPKGLDPYGKYELDDVRAYAKKHPEMELPQWPEIVPTEEEVAAHVRSERDYRIQKVRWRVDRHKDELELGLSPTEDIAPVLMYIQALRDVPQQEGFPHNIVWPIEPIGG